MNGKRSGREPDSTFRAAAIQIPAPKTHSAARPRRFDEVVSFRPLHAPAEHQPLNSAMRARLEVYEGLAAFRHEANRVPAGEARDAK